MAKPKGEKHRLNLKQTKTLDTNCVSGILSPPNILNNQMISDFEGKQETYFLQIVVVHLTNYKLV